MILFRNSTSPRLGFFSFSLLASLLFTFGCSSVTGPNSAIAAPQLQGRVHGGQQPVAGATIQLYAAGITGYGAGAVPLLSPAIQTDANGNFTITNPAPCPSSISQLYIVATGGNPGLPTPTNNTSLALMAAIGPCELAGTQYTLNPGTFIDIDEVTTVASVYALAGFMDQSTAQVGSSSTNLIGIANAFQTASNLANLSTGQSMATTPAGNGTVPMAEIDTLADIIAPCVNSTGTDSSCSLLFAAATPSGGSAPVNTLQALYNIATNPASQVNALFSLPSAAAPFQPTLAIAPKDWTIAVTYTGGGFSNARSMAIDSIGNIWVANNGTAPNTSSVTELSNSGAILSGPNGYTGGGMSFARRIAIDPSDNVWVADGTPNVVKLSNSGTVLSGPNGYTAPEMDFPRAIAIDGAGNAWVPNFGAVASPSVIKLGSDGTVLSGTNGFTAGNMNAPFAVAIDASENAWIANTDPGDNNVTELNTTGVVLSGTTGYGAGIDGDAQAVAIDASGNAWVIANGLDKFNSSGTSLSGPYGITSCPALPDTECGLPASPTLAIDGSGDPWVPFYYTFSDPQTGFPVTEYGFARVSNSGALLSGPSGYDLGTANLTYALAIDNSGNVWGIAGNNVMTELVGAATPVATPLSVGVKNHTLGTRP